MSKKKVYALLVEPNNKPKITELEEDDKAIKEIVGGAAVLGRFPGDERRLGAPDHLEAVYGRHRHRRPSHPHLRARGQVRPFGRKFL